MYRRDREIISIASQLISQKFTANVALERANGGSGRQLLTIGKLYGKVDAIVASKEFEMKPYKELDVIALRLGVAMGCKALVTLETEAGKVANFELLGVRKENKKVKMTVKAINGGDEPAISLKKVNMSIEVFWGASQKAAVFQLSELEARYNSSKKTLTFRNDDGGVDGIFWRPFFGTCVLSGKQQLYKGGAIANRPILYLRNRGCLEFSLRRNGSSKNIIVAANVDWIKADVSGIQLGLNNKGLTSDGRAAKEAINGLNGLKSGTYTVSINTIPEFVGFNGFGGSNGFGPGFGEDRDAWGDASPTAFPILFQNVVSLDVKGELKKTSDLGSFVLRFSSENESRIIYYTERDEESGESGESVEDKITEIKSVSTKQYLGILADMLKEASYAGYLAPYSAFVKFRLEDGKPLTGEIISLKDNNGDWGATVETSLADAEMLKNKTIVVGALIWGGV